MRKLLLPVAVVIGLLGVLFATAAHRHTNKAAVSAPVSLLVGTTTVQPTADQNGSQPQAWQYTASTSGSVTDVDAYDASGTSKLTVGLYSDSSGKPGKLLAKGSLASTKVGWNDVPVGATTVTSGTKYWLAWQGTDSFRDNPSGSCSTVGKSTAIGSVGSSWSSAWTASGYCPASLYVNGTPSGPPPPPPPPPNPVPPANTTAPAISGTPQVGDTLTVTNGTWTGDTPMTFSVEWSDGTAGSSDTLTSADLGQTVTATVVATNDAGTAPATSAAVGPVVAAPPPGSTYMLPSARQYDWNPGLDSTGGVPDANWAVYKTISPSGGDDTATIQAALDSCPKDGVVLLAAGVFHITGQGLSIENSNCVLRGSGPGPGTFAVGKAASGTGGTYLVKPTGTSFPVAIIGPRWGSNGSATNLTANVARGANSVTVASTAGLSAGELVTVDETTDSSISHWNSQDPENNSGWFEEPNRPLGETLEIQSISGNTVTFTTDFPIGYQTAHAAHLYPLTNQVNGSGIENLYTYGGEGGDGGGGIHLWNCAGCWVNHIEDTWTNGAAVHIDNSFQADVENSYFHDSQGGLYSGGANYGVGLNWYTSDSLIQNNIILNYNKDVVMRSAGGGNVWGYNYVTNGADLGGQWTEDVLDGNHMTTPHYELFEGNEAANADTGDRWGNSVYITYFRNDLTGENLSYPGVAPVRAAGLTDYDYDYSFVGNVLGQPNDSNMVGYEAVGTNTSVWTGVEWLVCYQNNDSTPDGGGCQSSVLRDGNFDYFTKQVHWHGIGGTGASNGLTPPADSTLPDSLYLTGKPAFFGTLTWPWVDGSSSTTPLPGQLPAQVRYAAGTPNTLIGG